MPFVICDVDDVLLEMGHVSYLAEAAMVEPLTHHLGMARAEAVLREFMHSIEIMRLQLASPLQVVQDGYHELIERIAWWQRGVTEANYEVKIWSRHALLTCALEVCELPVTSAVVHETIDHYWAFLTQRAMVYQDAAMLIQELRRANIPLHLATGSDGFLIFDEHLQTFTYDPKDAARLKLDRLHRLYELGFRPQQITVGDPVGKPSTDFFHAVLRDFSQAIGRQIELEKTVAIGDSLTHDILPLLELGAVRGIWLKRETSASRRETTSPYPNVEVVTQLDAQRFLALLDNLM